MPIPSTPRHEERIVNEQIFSSLRIILQRLARCYPNAISLRSCSSLKTPFLPPAVISNRFLPSAWFYILTEGLEVERPGLSSPRKNRREARRWKKTNWVVTTRILSFSYHYYTYISGLFLRRLIKLSNDSHLRGIKKIKQSIHRHIYKKKSSLFFYPCSIKSCPLLFSTRRHNSIAIDFAIVVTTDKILR